MKKLLLLMIALICFSVLKANPLPSPPPSITLSELAFDANGNWVIELQYLNFENANEYMPIDSIFISSSTGKSKIKRFKIDVNTGIASNFGRIVVRNDSLLSNLSINPKSDSVQVKYFISTHINSTVLTTPAVYGDFVTSTLPTPKAGQSIAASSAPGYYSKYNYSRYGVAIWSIDNSPTIGMENDTTGMLGTLKGNIYDINNHLITTSNLTYYGIGFYDILPNSDGSYSTRIFSCKYHITQIFYNSGTNQFILDIAPIDVTIQPDTVVTADIHILHITGLKELKSEPQQVIRIFPNPITDLSFKYAISIPVKSSNCFIELTNMNGQLIARYPITEDNGTIELPSHTANGTYTLRLFENNRNYGTSKIVIAH